MATKTEKTTAVAPKPEEKAGLPAVYDYGEDAGAGLDNIGSGEISIPFFKILQSNSPQVEDGGVDGARPGMIINLATNEVFEGKNKATDAGITKGGLVFIPVTRQHNFVEFVSRDAGGGFVGIRPADDPFVLKLIEEQGAFGKLINGENEISEAFYLYGLAYPENDPDNLQRGVVAFSSTQIKKYKNWITRMLAITVKLPSGATVRPPMWAHQWKIQTVPESNKKGSFHGWKIGLLQEPAAASRLDPKGSLYAQAKEFHELIKSGLVKVQPENEAASNEPGDEEIPM